MTAIFVMGAVAAFLLGLNIGSTRIAAPTPTPSPSKQTREPVARSGGIMAPCGCEVGGSWPQQCRDHEGLWVEWEIRPASQRRAKASDPMESRIVIGGPFADSSRAHTKRMRS